MTTEQKAKEIFEKYLGIIGTNCEHNCYCDREECNKLGYTFCHVDYKTAKACAIEEVKAVIVDNQTTYKILLENHAQRAVPPIIKREIELQNILTEIEKL